jgi:hypothetical protein
MEKAKVAKSKPIKATIELLYYPKDERFYIFIADAEGYGNLHVVRNKELLKMNKAQIERYLQDTAEVMASKYMMGFGEDNGV